MGDVTIEFGQDGEWCEDASCIDLDRMTLIINGVVHLSLEEFVDAAIRSGAWDKMQDYYNSLDD